MKTAKTIISTAIPFLFLTIMTLGLFGVVDIANAANVNCGDTITESTIMDADLVCTGMTGNIVTIGADDVVLDCNGHSITTDTASNAIFAFGTNNAEIKNCSISGSGVGSGIYIDHSTNHSIHNNTFTNLENGITYFRNARNSTIANNTFTDLTSGIYGYCYYAGSYFQDNTQVSGNSFNNISDWAVSLSNKGQFCTVNTDNTFVAPDNSFTNVTNGIMAYGKVVLENLNFTVNGSGLSVGSDAVVRNNIITGTGTGNGISVGAGNLVHDNRFTNFVSGVYLTSNDNEIRDNTFTDMENGIYSYSHYLRAYSIYNNTISRNVFENINGWVITQSSVSANSFTFTSDNVFININNGIHLSGAENIIENFNLSVKGTGINVGSTGNIVRNNVVNGTGIGNGIIVGAGNLVHDNRFTNFVSGVYLTSNDNEIRDNAFTDMENGIYSYSHYLRAYSIYNNTISRNVFENINGWVITQSSVSANSFTFTPDNVFININNGIHLSGSDNVLEGITLNVQGSGINVGVGNIVRNNVIYGTGTGSGIIAAADNIIQGNSMENFQYGVLISSNNNAIRQNTIKQAVNAIYASTHYLSSGNIYNTTIGGNTFEDLSGWVLIQSYFGSHGYDITESNTYINIANGIHLSGSDNMVKNQAMNVSGQGVVIAGNNNLIDNIELTGASISDGVYIGGTNNTVSNSTIKNFAYGIHIVNNENAAIFENEIINNNFGFYLIGQVNTVIYDNNILGSTELGIYSNNTLYADNGALGNCWDRHSSPYFIPGTDSNTLDITDRYAYCGPVIPSADNQLVTTNEDTPSDITLTGTDPKGALLTFSIVSVPANGVLTGTAPDIHYTPAPDFNGTDSFSFTVNNGTYDSSPSTVEITVNPVNDSPVADNDSYVTDEDAPLTVQAPGLTGNDSDADNDPLAAILQNGSGNSTVLLNSDGSFTYIPVSNFNGNDEFTYKASDGEADSLAATVSISVNPVNDDPIVAAGADTEVSEGDILSMAGSFSDPEPDTWSATVDYGDSSGQETLALNPDMTFSLSHTYTDNGQYSATVNIADDKGGQGTDSCNITVNNVPPLPDFITAPAEPVEVNTEMSVNASFTDPGIHDTHTAQWDWGDGSQSSGTVDETGGSGSAAGTHAYDTPGVYTVMLDLTDNDNAAGSAEHQYVVVYNPEGGFVTGGGWIYSPPEAYTQDSALEGKATFGFVSKYKKGATVPTGTTKFKFKVADLNFFSDSYEWLVIAGAKAQFKGNGSINEEEGYKFMLTALDADMNESDGFETDRFRIKIWSEDESGTETVIYDNALGSDAENATTEISGGAIVIHKK